MKKSVILVILLFILVFCAAYADENKPVFIFLAIKENKTVASQPVTISVEPVQNQTATPTASITTDIGGNQ